MAEDEMLSDLHQDVDMQSRSSESGLSCDVSYIEKASSQGSSSSQSEQLLTDDDSKFDIDDEFEEGASSESGDEESRVFGWTDEDNRCLSSLIKEMSKEKGQRVTWRNITERFNKQFNQKRTRTQLYSHFRYTTSINRQPCYLKAEEQLILALDEIGVPISTMLPFLVNDRSEKVLVAKIQKLKASNQAKALAGSKQAAFRKRIHEIVQKNGGTEAFKRNGAPKKVLDEVRYLIKSNPNLQNKYLNVKPAGRPVKRIKMIPVIEQLMTLFKPFSYINHRRKRTASMPGDGRKYGISLFCLNRLLGSPLELDKMPYGEEEAAKAGVEKSDYFLYANVRELLQAQKTSKEDREHYLSNPGGPPSESLLPPTLFTLAGLRGLLCYKDSLMATLAEEANRNLPDPSKIGNKESDERLERILMSMFQWSWHLLQFDAEPEVNSDGDSDTDEELCFTQKYAVFGSTNDQTLDAQVIDVTYDEQSEGPA